MPEIEQHIKRIAGEIEHYLLTRPCSVDSIEGITKWWLTRQRYQEAKKTVQKALNFLVVNGRIEEIINSYGSSVYGKKNYCKKK
jgi:hypothetical protein